VIGEDTDILVLLCYHAQSDSKKIFLRSDTKQAKPKHLWDIHKTQSLLTTTTCELLPFLHAVTGCDTTSKIYGVSKPAALKLLSTNKIFQEVARSFVTSQSRQDVVTHGEKVVMMLLAGDPHQNLDVLRYEKFSSRVMTSTSCIQVQTLPPTSAATALHSLRVFLQMQLWTGKTTLIPEDWGWQLKNGAYIPVKTDIPPAPEKLLKVVHCNYKVNCDSKRCSCRKHGLECSSGCGTCRGISCTNSGTADYEDI